MKAGVKVGDTVHCVFMLYNGTIYQNYNKGTVNAITKTQVKVLFQNSNTIVTFNKTFSKSYAPNEYFLGRNNIIVDDETFKQMKKQAIEVQERKNIVQTILTKMNTIKNGLSQENAQLILYKLNEIEQLLQIK